MPITPGSNHGSLTGAAEKELVAAPAVGFVRGILLASIYNKDTAVVTVTVSKKVAGVLYEVERVAAMDVNGRMVPVDGEKVLNLTDVDQSLVAVMSGAAATTNPTFACSWVDKPATAATGDSVDSENNILANQIFGN